MNPQLRPLDLQFAAHAQIELDVPLELGRVLTGQRRVIGIAGGRFEGLLLNATILPGGTDWQIVRPLPSPVGLHAALHEQTSRQSPNETQHQ